MKPKLVFYFILFFLTVHQHYSNAQNIIWGSPAPNSSSPYTYNFTVSGTSITGTMQVSSMPYNGPNFYVSGYPPQDNKSCVPAYVGKLRITSGTAKFTFNQKINASLDFGSIGKILSDASTTEYVQITHNGTAASISPAGSESCPPGLGTPPTVSGLKFTGVAQQQGNSDGSYRYGNGSGSITGATTFTINLYRGDGGGASMTIEMQISETNPPVCNLSATAIPTSCQPATNTYTLAGNLTFSNAPATGTLTVNVSGGGSQTFNAPFTSPLAYSIASLSADGVPHTVSASFSATPACSTTKGYSAPPGCIPAACTMNVTANPAACVPASNSYTLNGQVSFTNPPTTGTLTVNVSGGGSQTFNAPFTSPSSYSISSLPSDGGSKTVTATFSANTSCTDNENYSAPASCLPMVCSSTMSLAPGACSSSSNTYILAGSLSGTNWPTTGGLTITRDGINIYVQNGPFSSPINFIASGLTANGSSHNVQAVFSADGACSISKTYNSPGGCQAAVCSIFPTVNVGTCNSANNTYSVSGQLTLSGQPTTGTLTVSISGGGSQIFNAPFNSPLSYNIPDLNADGSSKTLSASYSADPACSTTAGYFAPGPCLVVCSTSMTTSVGACVPATNQYSISGQISFSNPPANGELIVSVVGGGMVSFPAPFTSPISYTIGGLTPTGGSKIVSAHFSADNNCFAASSYISPASCAPVLNCGVTLTANPGQCDPVSQNYTLTGSATLTDPPTTGTITFTVGGVSGSYNAPFNSPLFYILHGLPAQGIGTTVSVSFSDNPSCSSSKTFMSPEPCGCVMYYPAISSVCNDNGTGTVTDDTYTVTITAVTNNNGTTATLSGDLSGQLTYGVPSVFGPFPISGGSKFSTITDDLVNECFRDIIAYAPAPCSQPKADLQVVKTADKTDVSSGDTVVYSIAVTNNGPDPANSIIIKELLPAGVNYVSHIAPAGTTFTNGTGLWDIPTMTNGQVLTLTITVTVI